ncbi:MAG TPA: ACT domain-containing protein [Planctomycetaceae bacterium]|nr:ACT domain-containing protein [Planctomycetaceae bacterium]
MATKQYVMTVMAANRVGILAALATALDELGGGFVDLSQAIMRDYFTIILAVEFPENRHPDVIVDHIRAVCRPFGLDVMLRDPAAEPQLESTVDAPDSLDYLLRVKGQDRPGVLRRISLRLAQEGIDIADLYGERNDRTGTFETCLALKVPVGVDVTRLQADLEQQLRSDGLSVAVFRCDVLQAVSEPRPLVRPPRSRSGAAR